MSQNQEIIEAKLCAYIDDALDENGRAEIEAHLLENPQHRRLLEELRRTSALVRALPRETAPAELAEAFTGQLERSVLLQDFGDESDSATRHSGRMSHYLAVAAIVVLSVGLAAVVYVMLPSLTKRPQFAAADSRRSFPVPAATNTDRDNTDLASGNGTAGGGTGPGGGGSGGSGSGGESASNSEKKIARPSEATADLKSPAPVASNTIPSAVAPSGPVPSATVASAAPAPTAPPSLPGAPTPPPAPPANVALASASGTNRLRQLAREASVDPEVQGILRSADPVTGDRQLKSDGREEERGPRTLSPNAVVIVVKADDLNQSRQTVQGYLGANRIPFDSSDASITSSDASSDAAALKDETGKDGTGKDKTEKDKTEQAGTSAPGSQAAKGANARDTSADAAASASSSADGTAAHSAAAPGRVEAGTLEQATRPSEAQKDLVVGNSARLDEMKRRGSAADGRLYLAARMTRKQAIALSNNLSRENLVNQIQVVRGADQAAAESPRPPEANAGSTDRSTANKAVGALTAKDGLAARSATSEPAVALQHGQANEAEAGLAQKSDQVKQLGDSPAASDGHPSTKPGEEATAGPTSDPALASTGGGSRGSNANNPNSANNPNNPAARFGAKSGINSEPAAASRALAADEPVDVVIVLASSSPAAAIPPTSGPAEPDTQPAATPTPTPTTEPTTNP